jgi:predicted RNA-binding protein
LIPEGCRVISNTFAPESDVLAPGATAADPLIRDVDKVLASGPEANYGGGAAMSGDKMTRSWHGVALLVRKIKRL